MMSRSHRIQKETARRCRICSAASSRPVRTSERDSGATGGKSRTHGRRDDRTRRPGVASTHEFYLLRRFAAAGWCKRVRPGWLPRVDSTDFSRIARPVAAICRAGVSLNSGRYCESRSHKACVCGHPTAPCRNGSSLCGLRGRSSEGRVRTGCVHWRSDCL